MPRPRIVFRPIVSPRLGYKIDFPVFTYERLWERLAAAIDPDKPLSVNRDSGLERVHLAGQVFAHDNSDIWIYRVAENEYWMEERISTHDWVEQAPARAGTESSS